jgi:putative redox protein
MGSNVHVEWVSKGRFVGTDGHKHAIVMSTQDEENGTGMKPSELLLVALGGCSSVDVVSILQKKRQALAGLEVEITAEQEPEPPWCFRKINIIYHVRGRGLSDKAVADAIRLAEDKYCSVRATLDKSVEVHTEFRIVEAE